MTDFNTTAAETTTEAKAAPVITTAKHARFLAETARKRAEKLRTQAAEADAAAAGYDELAATLPVGHVGKGRKIEIQHCGTHGVFVLLFVVFHSVENTWLLLGPLLCCRRHWLHLVLYFLHISLSAVFSILLFSLLSSLFSLMPSWFLLLLVSDAPGQ
jgi:hypothetical protein